LDQATRAAVAAPQKLPLMTDLRFTAVHRHAEAAPHVPIVAWHVTVRCALVAGKPREKIKVLEERRQLFV
jgi:hypothetical protein